MGGLYQQYDAEMEADITMAEDFVVRIRSDLHPKMRKLLQYQQKKYRAHTNSNAPVPTAIQDQIDIEKAECAIVGWSGSGAVDREGKPMPYSPEAVRQVVTELPHFRRDVLIAMYSLASFQKAELAELGKSSSGSSAPTSSAPTDES
jgi:DNA replication protein DnaD